MILYAMYISTNHFITLIISVNYDTALVTPVYKAMPLIMYKVLFGSHVVKAGAQKRFDKYCVTGV